MLRCLHIIYTIYHYIWLSENNWKVFPLYILTSPIWSHPTPDKLESTLSEIAFTRVTSFLGKVLLIVFIIHSYLKHWPIPTIVDICGSNLPAMIMIFRNLNLHVFTIFDSLLADCCFKKKLKDWFILYKCIVN